ncbi:ABC transporter [Aspergillus ambiguus]|uniref:putative ABC bile acid transporter n=1 Tax=Aspergillus ambiguus TaxID=176160 RepID=UPI003CCDF569
MLTAPMLLTEQHDIRHACYPLWDSTHARLSPCAMRYASIAPGIIIAALVLGSTIGYLLRAYRPKWTRPFVTEQPICPDLPHNGSKQRIGWAISLFALSIIGMTAEMIKNIPMDPSFPNLVLLAAWVITAGFIAVRRPRSCPVSLLAFFLIAFSVEAIFIIDCDKCAVSKLFSYYIAAGAALAACATILVMPLRKPSLPCMDIGVVGHPPSSDYRSPEDNLRLWQFLSVSWMAPLMSMGKRRQLNEEDVWSLGFEFQHRRLHEKFRQLRGSVLGRLLQANGIDVVIITSISIVQMLCDFSTPILLQQLLQAMQDPKLSNRVALTYAILSLVLRLVAAQSQVLNIWYGRRCYERSRGEMIMMVYEKALSRKNVFDQQIHEKVGEPENDAEDGNDVNDTRNSRQRNWCGLFSRRSKHGGDKVKETASMGKIFNLLRGDVYEVAQRFWEVDTLVDKPVGLIIAIALVWRLLGPSCFLGILAILIAQAINALITRTLLRWERVRRVATDARLQISSQFVEALRHLRWYGWQNHWLQQVMDARQSELNLRIITSLWNVLIRFINAFASGVFPVVALYAYTMLAGHTFSIDIIFPALQLFTMLETRLRDIPGLITVLINASIAMERIEDFMGEPDKEKRSSGTEQSTDITLDSCSFAWPGRKFPVLCDINVTISEGLTVISGKVGAGKTALLQALLGELDRLTGAVSIPNDMIGYCAQTPWLQSMSIRDNILFSAPYDEQRYKRVLDVCALLPDLANFKYGDLSFVGENGIGLSGGQKARVALARAVYSTSRILLLDDPLSALDHNTAESIVRKCFMGPLMQGRVVVLVTHRTTIVRHLADQTIYIQQGRAIVEGKQGLSSLNSEDGTETPQGDTTDDDTQEEAQSEDHTTAVPAKFIEEEHRAEWGVKARVYWTYIRAGKYRWWILLVTVLAVYRLASVAQSWFLKEWGEAYNEVHMFLEYASSNQKSFSGEALAHSSVISLLRWSPKDPLRELPPPVENVKPWLLAFFAVSTFQAVMLLFAQLLMIIIVYCAGKTLFHEVMVGVSHATFRFFDVTPIGRLMNRLTSDIGVVDGNISEQFQIIAFQAITWVSSILVIASVTPTFLGFTFVLTAAFIITFLRFLPTSQSLRRLEMVSLSPLISNFGELLHGLPTMRAFQAESRFQHRVIAVVDKFQGMDHFYWSLQGWLMYRFESLSAVSTFCLTLLALYTNVSPGLAAFALIAANNFVASTHALCKQYGQLQMDFVSVERVDELLHVEQESHGTIEPPASWPRFGHDIVFEDVTIRYAPHLDPSLTNISLRIPGGSTTAVIGRTGSGKSTLAVALLNVVRPESGRVLIDGIDIAQVSTQALRTRVTFVAQDPVLFPGSIRLNLDPTGEYTDEECSDVLKRIGRRHGWSLETHVEAGGRNLSQGERQLIGLSRAVLRRSSIVILDEATASIDHESSLEIQQVIREEMRESTVITIAHRLEAIKGADYYIVLDQGGVSEQGYVNDK